MLRETGDRDSSEVAIRAFLGFGERKLKRERRRRRRREEKVEFVTASLWEGL